MAATSRAGAAAVTRFVAPTRGAIAPEIFAQPAFAEFASWRDLLLGPDWPTPEMLDARLQPLRHAITGRPLALLPQSALLGDGCHYEQRIHEHGQIATRADNWHDLFNALVWKRYPAIKSALNARQAEDLARVGPRQRTRGQDALTQFDEAGAVVCVRDARLLALWDAHDWAGLFLREREAWRDGRLSLLLFGHAVLEHALNPAMLLVAKSLVFVAPAAGTDIDALAAEAIASGRCLLDPQELRPLPLSGLPGWHGGAQDEVFYREQPCFRPLRAGRVYPAPMTPT